MNDKFQKKTSGAQTTFQAQPVDNINPEKKKMAVK